MRNVYASGGGLSSTSGCIGVTGISRCGGGGGTSRIVSQCVEASFSLAGEDEAECIEVVETFKYLGHMLDRSYYD